MALPGATNMTCLPFSDLAGAITVRWLHVLSFKLSLSRSLWERASCLLSLVFSVDGSKLGLMAEAALKEEKNLVWVRRNTFMGLYIEFILRK